MPKDLTEPTFCGAVVSVICTIVLLGLSIFEIQNFLRNESHAELIIDTTHRDDFVNVNVDVMFPRMPCDILGLDVEDILGTHKTDVMGELFKKRLDSNGKVLSTESAHDKEESRSKIRDRAREELKAKQGCQFTGFIKVYRVPGDFHIASHTFDDIIFSLRNEGYHLDYSYKINHISFGKKKDHDYI
jgi:hypothetical protein